MSSNHKPLKGVHILSLALNLPGPAAMMRCRQMGARCRKLEPPAGDPMRHYSPPAYAELHEGVTVLTADLKSETGQRQLHRELAKADVLLTSFRPSALSRLGLGWAGLHRLYPLLSQVAIFGSHGAGAEDAGHDLTYLAAAGLVTGLVLPSTLYVDMAGSLAASEAVLRAVMMCRAGGKGVFVETTLQAAAGYLARPHVWGLTTAKGMVGGAHAGYQLYPCKDGRVAVAALEPHFAARLCSVAGISGKASTEGTDMLSGETRRLLTAFFLISTRKQIEKLAQRHDIPLCTLSK